MNYLFHIATARTLGIDDYGTLGTFLAVFMITAALSVGFNTYFAKNADQHDIPTLLKAGLGLGAGCMGLGFLTPWPFIASAFIGSIIFNWTAGVLRGWEQFNGRLDRLGGIIALETFSKLLFWFLLARFGLTGALWAMNLGMLASVIFFWPSHAHARPFKEVIRDFWHARRHIWQITMQIIGLGLFLSSDMLLIKLLHPQDAGGYNVIIKFSQMVFFLSGMVVQVVYSQAMRNENTRWGLWAVLFLGLGGAIGSFFLGHFFINLLFGAAYAPWAWLLPFACLSMTLLSLVNLQLNLLWAKNQNTSLTIMFLGLGMFCGLAFGLSFWPLGQDLGAFGVVLAQMVGLGMVLALISVKKHQKTQKTTKIMK